MATTRPRLRFFGGKGGVGKTTCAAAHAVAAASAGARVLAVSTDPAHSLGDALDVALAPTPVAVPLPGAGDGGATGRLAAVELAAEAAFDRWLATRRAAFGALAERGSILTAEEADRLLALPIPGVDELLALLEVARLARGGDGGGGSPAEAAAAGSGADLGKPLGETCDHLVIDTAPTAHTLRLLALPAALARLAAVLAALDARRQVLAASFGGGPVARDPVVAEIERDAAEVHALLTDSERADFSWVLLPEALSLRETEDALAALAGAGVAVGELVVNRVLVPQPGCPVCAARAAAEQAVLGELAGRFPDLPIVCVPELPEEPRGVTALRAVARSRTVGRPVGGHGPPSPTAGPGVAPVARSFDAPWLIRLAPPGVRLLFFGGKGGVGKTTCAAAFALTAAAAENERPVRLLSTDPAHSLADVLGVPLGDDERPVPGAAGRLSARELDAPRRWARLQEDLRRETAGLLAWEGEHGGAEVALDRELLDRLLAATPPGLDELMALAALVDAVAGEGDEGRRGDGDGAGESAPSLLVVDTAATGHALRLLQMPELALRWDHALLAILLEYRHAARLGRLAEELVELSRSLKRLRAVLADPVRTRFVVVTRAAELPRRETGRLLRALGELGIAVPAVLVNRLLTPGPGCPRCAATAAAEDREVAALVALAAAVAAVGPVGPVGPVGRDILQAPATFPPPRGAAELTAWAASWH